MATATPLGNIKALAFDAYGTLFDVFSVTARCEQLFPGSGAALTQLWRAKQLQYSILRSLMGRYEDFWQLTEDALLYAAESLKLELTATKQQHLMDAYLNLAVFPDVGPGLAALKTRALRLAILSNGTSKMLDAAVNHAGIGAAFDAIVTADELKIFKPSPSVYRSAPPRLRVAAGALGFVSSNSWDVSGAASAGLTTFWLQRSAAEPADRLGFPATYVITSLYDLSGLFR
ncbi:MAG TPA: haloacid dehalogenase type II [Vicinamibacterales bacterium]|jgi:2-haloacid dehalogenase|nr:haloacid dehalogenase type II [Vicinamibacterales bacterium]